MTSPTISQPIPGAAPNVFVLRQRISGPLLTPADQEYDEARQLHDISFNRRPWIIVQAAQQSDVVEAVRFARHHNIPLSVRSGGHSVAGHSVVDGAIVIDMSAMKNVVIDAEAGTARVQAGATSGDLAGPAHAYGFALSTGDTSTVGLGGLTTGGGIGWMVRKYGLAIDNLLSVNVVTADGRLITASPTQHSELFWALRGGGGNFGIVTEFEFKLAPVGAVYGGALVLPATRDVIRGYLEYARTAPDELTTIAQVMHAPPAPFVPADRVGELSFVIAVCYAGDPEESERVVAPLRALATPIAEAVAPMPYPAMFMLTEIAAQRHGAAVKSMFADEISDESIGRMIRAVESATSPFSMVQLRVLGGAMRRVAPGDTAFGHREREYMVSYLGLWLDPNDDGEAHRQWAARRFEEVASTGIGTYCNFLGDEGEARIRDAYPAATYRRLAEVKQQYDPENFFRFNQNIRASGR